MSKRTQPLLKIRVVGPRPGTISVPDLIRICQSAQNAVSRQAEAMRGGQSLRSGPRTAVVQEETTLELVGIEKGSTVLPFAFVKPQQHVFPDALTFGKDAIFEVTGGLKKLGGAKAPKTSTLPPGVLDSLKEMTDVFDKGVVTKIEWIVPKPGKKPVKAVLDRKVRDRVIHLARVPTTRPDSVEGSLEMADFREGDYKCRIHPTVGQSIVCTFTPEQEELVYDALRKPVRVKGTATINPNNDRIEQIAIEHIEVVDQLFLGEKEFRKGRSLEDLALVQGVEPLTNPRVLAGGFPEDEDVDSFLEEIYSSRVSQ